jgi:hypothetical protein
MVVMCDGRLVADGAPGNTALHHALVQVFGGALTIEPVAGGRWVAVPAL